MTFITYEAMIVYDVTWKHHIFGLVLMFVSLSSYSSITVKALEFRIQQNVFWNLFDIWTDIGTSIARETLEVGKKILGFSNCTHVFFYPESIHLFLLLGGVVWESQD